MPEMFDGPVANRYCGPTGCLAPPGFARSAFVEPWPVGVDVRGVGSRAGKRATWLVLARLNTLNFVVARIGFALGWARTRPWVAELFQWLFLGPFVAFDLDSIAHLCVGLFRGSSCE